MLIADIVQSLQEVMLDYFISQKLGRDGLAAFAGCSFHFMHIPIRSYHVASRNTFARQQP